ncbi:hypothetical protein JCM8208_002496 [Rhodotorula glutinis]
MEHSKASQSHSPPLLSPPPPFEPRSSYTRGCESLPRSASTRRLILCFDGTSNTFGLGGITNLPVLFSLTSADPAKQLLYYQVGVGQSISAHESNFAPRRVRDRLLAVLDEAIACTIGQHICGGYRFLMDHWKPGDEIFLFGFSRGAYTARALAGMLQQVGLLPAGNEDSIPLAYSIYSRKADTPLVPGVETLAEGFKRTFSRDVEVHFVGVWDTVASVGALVPRTLPFASSASYIHIFRHALALDEARTRYMPQPWMPPYPDFVPSASSSDVKEVWFAGAHSNVGGGEFKYDGGRTPALAHLSLRWMLREAVEAGFQVDSERVLDSPLFESFKDRAHVALAERGRGGADGVELERFLERATHRHPGLNLHVATVIFLASRPSDESTKAAFSARANHTSFKLQHRASSEPRRIGAKVADWWSRVGTRSMTAFWWLLEVSPSLKVVWDAEGNTRRRKIRSNNGKGRLLPSKPLLHYSVLERRDAAPADLAAAGNNENYPEGVQYKIKAKFMPGESSYTAPVEL